MFENDYEAKLKEKIELANLLVGLSDKDTETVHSLYLQKKEIIKKNSFLANIRINKINKKIEKIRNKYNPEDLEQYKNSLETHSIFEPNQNNSNDKNININN